jgi:hypothetical protein
MSDAIENEIFATVLKKEIKKTGLENANKI